MNRVLLYTLIAAAALWASDFQTGLDAYNRGDYATALKEWQPLAEKGDANSEYNLGLLYARGQGVPQDYAKAAEWYRKAAEQDVPAAEYNLGVIYANGQGVQANPEEARKWFLKAAQQGVGEAARGLGRIYSESGGSFQNAAEAEKWYREAADKGVASAAFNLAVMYDLGQGVQKNYEEALKWYRKAADAGYAPALTNLGILYYNAQGVKRDLIESYAWMARAQKLGDPRAGELISSVTSKMTPSQLKKAQGTVDQWQPSQKNSTTVEANLFKAPPAEAPAPAASTVAAAVKPAAAAVPETKPAAAPESTGGAERNAAPAAPAVTPKPGGSASIPAVWTGVERVIAIGDIHGDFEQFVQVLRSANLVDDYGNWTGGKTHLVQTGDVVDRGPDSRAVMDMLMKLEKQAAAAGGAVHCLIGNHEAMDVYGDLRFVSPAEFASYRPEGSGAGLSAYPGTKSNLTGAAKPDLDRSQWELSHPAGFAEHRAAFGPEGRYGKWIRSHNAVIKIDRTLFVHAGLGPKYAGWSIDNINDEVRSELNDFSTLHGGIVTDEQGPLWYSGLAKGDPGQTAPLVQQILKNYDVDRIVIGHTYSDAAITPRFNGEVVMIDVGIPRVYDNIGKVAALEIDHGTAYALHRGHRLELPKNSTGPDMLRYLQQAAAFDPQPSPLQDRIKKMQQQ